MPKCDTCGEEFDTERGLHIHQSQKHGDEAEDTETQEQEVETEEAEEESSDEESVQETESTDEVVKEIEEETSGALLGGYSRESVLVGGAFLGIALGLVVGLMVAGTGFDNVSPDEVREQVQGLPGVEFNVTSVTEQNGVYEVNATRQVSLGNQSVDRTIQLYVSTDGEMLFLQGTSFEQLRAQLEQQQAQPQQPPTTDSGDTSAENTTAP